LGGGLVAGEPNAQQLEFFEKQVRPVLVEHCSDCHSGEEPESDLDVDSLAGLLRGGIRGAAIVPGKPGESLLLSAVNHGEILKMPPKRKLQSRVIADLAKWIEDGAAWPNAQAMDVEEALGTEDNGGPQYTDEERSFWAFRPPVEPAVPDVQNTGWVRSPIDNFILAKLERKDWTPAAAAEKRTLIRRATFDLIGLPPTPAEVDAFLADDSPLAFARVVDRLLESPHYGERWGRHWLDVARYADSNGLDENLAYANAYRYRDYVVRAFNADKPYDQFVREQLAGDLLPASGDPQGDIDRITATGFLSLGAKMLAEDDPVKMQMDIIDEQIDTMGRAFMGLTLGCARCHDHKFDPIGTDDYYALAGIFKSTQTMENFKVVARWLERPLATSEQLRELEAHAALIEQAQAELADFTAKAHAELKQTARQSIGQYLIAGTRFARFRSQLAELAPDDVLSPDEYAGAVLVEAEQFDRGNLTAYATGYGEGIGVIAGPGGLNFAEYDFDVAQSGSYDVAIRYAAAQSRPTRLIVNGLTVHPAAAAGVTGSWYPDTQQWNAVGICILDEGPATIRLERDGPVPHVDQLLLVPRADRQSEMILGESKASASQLQPGFVRQWADYLDASGNDGDSLLGVWHRFAAGAPLAEIAAALDSPPKDLIEPQPASLSELADRYQQLFDRAQQAWAQLKSSEQGSQATALPDALLERFRKIVDAEDGPLAVPKNADESYYTVEVAAELLDKREAMTALEKARPQYAYAMAVSDVQQVGNVRVHIRGSHLTLGREVARAFPQILAHEQPGIGDEQSGRLQMAQWLTDLAHPLTARVMVNRIWLGHFGAGLVGSPDNFGRLGERPSHSELLDWLALRFIESGWSIKQMHRTIMLSSAYQMSTAYNQAAAEADPENRLLWRMNRRRLEAEAIRDAILAVGGSLDLSIGGTQLPTENRKYVTSTANVNPVAYEGNRRSIYLPVVRSALYEVFQAFDFADPSTAGGKRQTTTITPQALFMMNSKLVADETRALAERLLEHDSPDHARRVERIYQLCYSRPPSDDEIQRALRYVGQYVAADDDHQTAGTSGELQAWQSLCRAVVASNEFVYVE